MPESKSSLPGWVVVGLTAVLAITAVVQLVVFVESQRAFVAPTSTKFAEQLVAGMDKFRLQIELRNSGRSTATIKELRARILEVLPDEPPQFQANIYAMPPVAPGGTVRSDLKFEAGWDEDFTNGVLSGSRNLHMYGVIKYEDVFSSLGFGPKETGFCYIYVAAAAGFQNCPEIPYTYTK